MNLTPETAALVYEDIRARLGQVNAGELVGVSCIARGADSIFAQAVIDVGGRLEVVIPSTNYRARKVKPDHAHQFDELIQRATLVDILPFEEADADAYEVANEKVFGSVDLMFAVWDGDAGPRSGTASVVELLSRRGIPFEVIWPAGSARS
jgi:hypothetical protein